MKQLARLHRFERLKWIWWLISAKVLVAGLFLYMVIYIAIFCVIIFMLKVVKRSNAKMIVQELKSAMQVEVMGGFCLQAFVIVLVMGHLLQLWTGHWSHASLNAYFSLFYTKTWVLVLDHIGRRHEGAVLWEGEMLALSSEGRSSYRIIVRSRGESENTRRRMWAAEMFDAMKRKNLIAGIFFAVQNANRFSDCLQTQNYKSENQWAGCDRNESGA